MFHNTSSIHGMRTSIRPQPVHGMNQHIHVRHVKGDNDMVSLLPSTEPLIMSDVHVSYCSHFFGPAC